MAAGAIAATALLALALLPARGRAVYYPPQCGGDHIIEPKHHPRGQYPPLAIGDSTMLLAAYDLADAGYEVDAQGCREYPEALQILARRRAAGTLPHMVLIALGADGSVSRQDIGRALGLLCCTRLLVLVTPRELGGGSGEDAVVTRDEAARHRNRTLLLDWVRYAAGHGDWFQPDGLHLTDVGAVAFTRLLRRALPYAYPRTPPKPPAWTLWPQARCAQTTPGLPEQDAWAPARRRLAPTGVIGVRLCRYSTRLLRAVVLPAARDGGLRHDLDQLRQPTDPSRLGSCPAEPDPIVAHLAYRGHRTVTVYVRTNGCRFFDNGDLVRTGQPAVRDAVVSELMRLSGA